VDITISTKNEENLRAKRLEGSSKMGGEASATSFYLAVLIFQKFVNWTKVCSKDDTDVSANWQKAFITANGHENRRAVVPTERAWLHDVVLAVTTTLKRQGG